MGAGLAIIGVSLLLMARIGADRAGRCCSRLRPRRYRDRAHEPGARLDCCRRRPARTIGHGIGDEQHVPSGRNHHGDRRTWRAVPGDDRLEADPARRHGSRARSRRGSRLGRVPAGDRAAGAEAFVDSLGSILTIAAIVAIVGAVLVVVLLRGRAAGATRLLPVGGSVAARSRITSSSSRAREAYFVFSTLRRGRSRAAVALNDATTTSPSRKPSRSAEAAVTSATIGPTRTRVRLPSGTIDATVARMWLTAESAGSSRPSETSHG